MPKTDYIAYLKSQGASDEDIKVLAESSVAVRAFDAAQAQIAAEVEARAKAEETVKQTNEWYQNDWSPSFNKVQQDLVVARAEAERNKTALLEIQKQGLADVAKLMGYDPAKPPTAPVPDPNGFDPNKYLTKDQIIQIAAQEGEAIAIAQDIAYEHRQLFPDKPLNFRELRKEAVAAKKPVEQLWMERFKVADAREARAKAERDAEVSKLVAEQVKTREAEIIARYGNPDLRAPVPSTSPFTTRPNTSRDKQPWERNENIAENDRVQRATQKVLERSAAGR